MHVRVQLKNAGKHFTKTSRLERRLYIRIQRLTTLLETAFLITRFVRFSKPANTPKQMFAVVNFRIFT